MKVGETLSALASWKIVTRDGCFLPPSRWDMKLLSRLLISASLSCDSFRSFRSPLMTCPNDSSMVRLVPMNREPIRIMGKILLTIVHKVGIR